MGTKRYDDKPAPESLERGSIFLAKRRYTSCLRMPIIALGVVSAEAAAHGAMLGRNRNEYDSPHETGR